MQFSKNKACMKNRFREVHTLWGKSQDNYKITGIISEMGK